MAASYEEFEELYKKHFGELLLPILQRTITELCSEGGKIWEYISDLVVKGVYRHVYGAYYNPYMVYIRRYGSGGLADPHNVVITITDGVIEDDWINFGGEMRNITPPGSHEGNPSGTGGPIEDQVIGGYGYDWPLPFHQHYRGDFHLPRNFYQVYEEEFDPNTAWGYVLEIIEPILPKIQEMALEAALFETFK